MPAAKSKTTIADSLAVISTVALASFVIALLYGAREIFIPLALAALLTFLLAPLVTRLERWIGRIAAVLTVVSMIFATTGMMGWVFTRQLIDLASKLPNYQENIVSRLHAIRLPEGPAFSAFSKTVEELKKELPGADAAPGVLNVPAMPVSVQQAEPAKANTMELIQSILAPVLGPLGTSALVLLLVVFMLLQREDLRNRLIRLIGQGRISATTRAMDDAGQRVSRYLLMQLVVNVSYGAAVAIGLSFIGVPNAILWGGFSAVLRFIPYVGPWIGAAIPIILSLAVSASWPMPLLTLGLFVTLELLCNNVVEPWLYGSSTGVSSIALIVAAVAWTWLWGPVGLVLATPLTVCLVVMGRYVPRLSFLSVLLSDEEALTPAEDCYHRLLTPSTLDEVQFVNAYLKTGSFTELYDSVFIPVITTAEIDVRQDALGQEQLLIVEQSMRDIIEDLALRPLPAAKLVTEQPIPEATTAPTRIHCLPARAMRDEMAGAMLAHLLQNANCEVFSTSGQLAADELLGLLEKTAVDAVCISVVEPSTVIHARYLCLKVRAQFPHLKIIIGLWGATEDTTEATKRLRDSGADDVIFSLAEAVTHITEFAALPAS
jgi:predicted PurR-regulated permease PerM